MTFRDLIQQMRVRQWTKNTVLFAGVVFSHRFTEVPDLLRATEGFFAFCLLASSVYVLNDLKDVEKDRIHPKKRFRPIASGRISTGAARALLVVLLGSAFAVSWPLGSGFVITAAVYYTLNIAYTLRLKNVVILDVMIIALGFVLRAVAGVQALTASEEISPWLLICTLFLALFLAVCKRRQERVLLAESAEDHRKTLEEYPPELVDQLIPVVTAATVISYAIYTVSPVTVEKFGTQNLVYTIPFVVFGVFRYLYLVFRRQRGGSPSEVLLTDLPTLLNVLAWGVTIVAILSISGGAS
ncbi:MAG: decaprenyl-phosphate phosphoribosyltransferase [Candidatus Eisenbacteria bacterium]